jgi:hypothetical protein
MLTTEHPGEGLCSASEDGISGMLDLVCDWHQMDFQLLIKGRGDTLKHG